MKRKFGNHFFKQTHILDEQLMTYLIYYRTNPDLTQHIHLSTMIVKKEDEEKDKDRREKQEIRLEGNKRGTERLQLLRYDFHLITVHFKFK